MERFSFFKRFFFLPIAVMGIIFLFIGGCDTIDAVDDDANSTAFLALTNASQNGPAGMAFYTPPSPLPAGNHGDLDLVPPG